MLSILILGPFISILVQSNYAVTTTGLQNTSTSSSINQSTTSTNQTTSDSTSAQLTTTAIENRTTTSPTVETTSSNTTVEITTRISETSQNTTTPSYESSTANSTYEQSTTMSNVTSTEIIATTNQTSDSTSTIPITTTSVRSTTTELTTVTTEEVTVASTTLNTTNSTITSTATYNTSVINCTTPNKLIKTLTALNIIVEELMRCSNMTVDDVMDLMKSNLTTLHQKLQKTDTAVGSTGRILVSVEKQIRRRVKELRTTRCAPNLDTTLALFAQIGAALSGLDIAETSTRSSPSPKSGSDVDRAANSWIIMASSVNITPIHTVINSLTSAVSQQPQQAVARKLVASHHVKRLRDELKRALSDGRTLRTMGRDAAGSRDVTQLMFDLLTCNNKLPVPTTCRANRTDLNTVWKLISEMMICYLSDSHQIWQLIDAMRLEKVIKDPIELRWSCYNTSTTQIARKTVANILRGDHCTITFGKLVGAINRELGFNIALISDELVDILENLDDTLTSHSKKSGTTIKKIGEKIGETDVNATKMIIKMMTNATSAIPDVPTRRKREPVDKNVIYSVLKGFADKLMELLSQQHPPRRNSLNRILEGIALGAVVASTSNSDIQNLLEQLQRDVKQRKPATPMNVGRDALYHDVVNENEVNSKSISNKLKKIADKLTVPDNNQDESLPIGLIITISVMAGVLILVAFVLCLVGKQERKKEKKSVARTKRKTKTRTAASAVHDANHDYEEARSANVRQNALSASSQLQTCSSQSPSNPLEEQVDEIHEVDIRPKKDPAEEEGAKAGVFADAPSNEPKHAGSGVSLPDECQQPAPDPTESTQKSIEEPPGQYEMFSHDARRMFDDDKQGLPEEHLGLVGHMAVENHERDQNEYKF